ncbi:MAG: hypothetical protein NTU53_15195 [Planctomycetota bacterium]|nr:hypothetical protein [Planctomycetota bacterium]
MPNDSVIIKIDGSVSVADFRVVVSAFADLLLALTAETNVEAVVDWIVSDLRAGSTQITGRGTFGNAEGKATVETVVREYENLSRAAREGRIEAFSIPVREAMQSITSVINGKIRRILMSTLDTPDLVAIENRLEEVDSVDAHSTRKEPRPYARAAIKGQIVTLDDKHGVYFTLQEAYTQRHIRCWPGKKQRSNLGRFWEAKTWIIVEGTYMRYGNSPSLTHITDIVELPDAEKGSWRQAIGAAPRGPGAQDISSADAVRKVRDGEA